MPRSPSTPDIKRTISIDEDLHFWIEKEYKRRGFRSFSAFVEKILWNYRLQEKKEQER